MKKPLVLTYDIGTQSLRAMLVNQKGDIVAINQVVYDHPYFSKQVGYAEQKPNFYFDKLIEATKNLQKTNSSLFKDVIAVTVTCIRDTCLCLDEHKKPLRDIIVWLDKREANKDELPDISSLKKTLFAGVGVSKMIDMQQKQSTCNWIMTKEPEIWKKTFKFVMLPTYINYLLTGVLTDSVANQIGHIPIDYKNGVWYKKGALTRFLFDVPEEKLVSLVKPGTAIGALKSSVAKELGVPEGTPLIATGSDKGCETLGLSVFSKNKAAVSFGTTATVQFTNDNYFEPAPFAPSYPAVVDGYYNSEIQIYRGYWTLTWFRQQFCAEEMALAKKKGVATEILLNKHLADVPPCNNGLLVQPYWGAGVSNPTARGAMIGFTDVHTKYHLYRGIIEGINYALYEGMKQMEKRGKQKIEEVYVGGGGSQSPEICQITADMFGLPVKRIQTHEACGIGSSIVAFVSMGVYESIEEAIKHMVRDKDVFKPDMKLHEKYMKYYGVYSKIYKRLLPLYNELKEVEQSE